MQKAPLVLLALLAVAGLTGCSAAPPPYRLPTDLAVSDDRFPAVLESLVNTPLVEGNAVHTLVNGDEIFPAMLAAIRGAQHSITLETFTFLAGDVGLAFTDALCERARAGVPVHLLIDAVGSSKIDKHHLKRLEDCGVEVVCYHPLKWTQLLNPLNSKLNFRTHRKLMVVDGRIGFIGGVAIADEWSGDAQDTDHWRDNHYRVEGPVVAQLQAAFMDNWIETTGQLMTGRAYFPVLENAGGLSAQVVSSAPESGGSGNLQRMYLLFIAGARDSLLLCTPYFVLDPQSHRALIAAKNAASTSRSWCPVPSTSRSCVRPRGTGGGPCSTRASKSTSSSPPSCTPS